MRVLSYRYRLHPTVQQAVVLRNWLSQCRQLYNAALEQRITAYKRQGKTLSRYEQQIDLTKLRRADPVFAAVPARVQRSVIEKIDRAYRSFFRRLKEGVRPGFPRFLGPNRYKAFSFGAKSVKLVGGQVSIPKLGLVRLNLYRQPGGPIREVTIRFDGKKWWISLVCVVGDAPVKKTASKATGIDLGLTAFVTLADGSKVENPRFFRKSERLLKRRQRALARKKRGSASRLRARQLVAQTHEHIRNQRLDFARKLSAFLFNTYDLIAYEDLSIRGLARGVLSKSVRDAAWGVFIRCLTSKAENAGKWAVLVNPRGTSIRCSGCGEQIQKSLDDRVHRCDTCKIVLDRDENAAINILALGQSALEVLGGPRKAKSGRSDKAEAGYKETQFQLGD